MDEVEGGVLWRTDVMERSCAVAVARGIDTSKLVLIGYASTLVAGG